MTMLKDHCAVCGAEVTVQAPAAFTATQVVVGLCPSCVDSQFADAGGCVLALRREPEGSRFRLRKVRVTPGAVSALAASAQHAATFLARHVRGDWGALGDCDRIELTDDERRQGWEATDDDAKVNKSNLLNRRDSVMSRYTTDLGIHLWIITRLDWNGGTTVLLPEES
jgi:hypothetical protein